MAYQGPIMNNTGTECVMVHETFIIKYVHVQLHYTTNSTCTELRKNVFIDPELKNVLRIASFSLFFSFFPSFLSFLPRRCESLCVTFPLVRLVHLHRARYDAEKFCTIHFTTKLKSSQCVLDVVESPLIHSYVF